jgi:Fe-S-cluster-containing hydrogenase component 2
MKNFDLFFQPKRCTGCQLCLLACSLKRQGVCGENASLIRVLVHPKYNTSTPVILEECLDSECGGECVAVCTPGVLKLADEKLGIKLMVHPNWQPVPLLFQEKK